MVHLNSRVEEAYFTPAQEESFWSRVNKTGDCWLWEGRVRSRPGRFNEPVGLFTVSERPWMVHRMAYILYFGNIPRGHDICSTCLNRLCVRKEHLLALLPINRNKRSNSLSSKRGQSEVCSHGHLLTIKNSIPANAKQGFRACRICHMYRQKARKFLTQYKKEN